VNALSVRDESRDSVLNHFSILDVYEYCSHGRHNYSARTHHLRGGDYIVSCPVEGHDDKHPSCRLSVKSNYWSCYACGRGGKRRLEGGVHEGSMLGMIVLSGRARNVRDAAEWLEQRSGIVLRNLREQPPTKRHHVGESTTRRLKNEKLVAEFPYCDLQGTLLYQARRYEGLDDNGQPDKRFVGRRPAIIGEMIPEWKNVNGKNTRSERPAKAGDWSYNLSKTPRIPYRLPELREACAQHKAILVVEGEQKVDLLRKLGFAATTNYGGASWEWPASWAPFFDGAEIVMILADADVYGRAAALARKAFFETHTKAKALIVDLFPERTNGDDIVQWFEEHGNDAGGKPLSDTELGLKLRLHLQGRWQAQKELTAMLKERKK